MTATRPVPPSGGATRGVLTGAAQSLVATVLPLALGLVALPVLTRGLGPDRIALLLLAWSWLGLAQLLDLGLGRALVRRLASAHAQGTLGDAAALVAGTARALGAVAGVVTVLGAGAGTWYVTRSLGLPPALVDDARAATLLFTLAIPPTVAAAAPRAVLEAVRDFRTTSAIRLAVNAATFAVPLLLLPVTTALAPTALVLLGVRCGAWWALHRAARARLATTTRDGGAQVRFRALVRDGGWITVSNVLAPVLGSADRFIIGALAGTAAVAHYAVPHEAVTKALFVPAALTTALFPALAAIGAVRRDDEAATLQAVALRASAALVLPAMAVVIVAAPTIMTILAGAGWSAESGRVLVWLALGVAANALAMVPFTALHAAGAARSVALLHLAEAVPYVVLLLAALHRFGVEGAAIAWSARVVVDAVALAVVARRTAPITDGIWLRLLPAIALVAALGALVLGGIALPPWVAVAGVTAVAAMTVPRRALGALQGRLARSPAP